MEQKKLRWAAVGAAFVLFAAVDLLVLLVTDLSGQWGAFLPPLISSVIVLATLPSLLSLYQTQQDRIDRQRRQIATLHAMDTAIAAEQEVESLLDVAVRYATRALDAEMGGVLLPRNGGGVEEEAFLNVPENQRDRFRAVLREESVAPQNWQIIRVPLRRGDEVLGAIGAARLAGGRPFLPEDHSLLADLAGTVVVAVTNARTLRGARATERALARERRITEAFQEGLLPVIPARCGPFALGHRYEAHSDEARVGGDIYDLFSLDGGRRWAVVIADVTGKGLAAARQTAMVKYALRSYAREHASPADVLTRLNDALCDEPEMTGFVTLVYVVLCPEDGSFTYASAGHEMPLLIRAGDETVEMLAPTGVVLGAAPNMEYREETHTLYPGDGLLLYTDGLSEARPAKGKFLETEGVSRILVEERRRRSAALADAVLSAVRDYGGGRLMDDAAVLWIERCE